MNATASALRLAQLLLLFAAWPMLAACVVLYVPRDDDTLLVPGR